MARKGQLSPWETLVAVGIVVILGIVLYTFVFRSGSTGSKAFTCDTTDPQYACADESAGCPPTYDRDYFKVWGCPAVGGKAQMCCSLKSTGTGGSGSTSSPVPQIVLQPYKLDIRNAGTAMQIQNRDPLRGGLTIPVFAEQPYDLMIEAQVQACDTCGVTGPFRKSATTPSPTAATFTFKIENSAGNGVLPRVADQLFVDKALKAVTGPKDLSSSPDIMSVQLNPGTAAAPGELRGTAPYNKFMADKNFRLVFGSNDAGDTFTLTGKLALEYDQIVGSAAGGGITHTTQTVEQTVVMRFQVKPAVRYGSLTQKWEQSKHLFANCEDPVKCTDVYYVIVGNTTLLPPAGGGPGLIAPVTLPVLACPDFAKLPAPKKIEDVTRYYMIDEAGRRVVATPFAKLDDCLTQGMGSVSDPGYSAAYNLFIKNVGTGKLPPEVGVLFQNSLNKASRISCQADVDVKDGMGQPFIATRTDPAVARWDFTLDKPYMQDQYLCVYAKGTGTTAASPLVGPPAPIIYSAGKPQQIKIDRTAPIAGIQTDAVGTHLKFLCDDTGSGCQDYRGVAYITNLDGYLNALFAGGQQSAALWCPDYRTGNAYTTIRQPEMQYLDPVVRAMCVRVVDKAGNAGVTLTVVGWPMFFLDLTVKKILPKYIGTGKGP